MNENADSRRSAALKKLAEHLASLKDQGHPIPSGESEMVSMIVSGVLNGENVSRRYPAFHAILLENAELRQAFLDALEAVEAERAGEMMPLPGSPDTNLDFLTRQPSAPVMETFGGRWRATWQRSLEQIQAVFSPPQLVFRADPMIEEPWFTLLREEITAAGAVIAIELDCSLSPDLDNALAAHLTLAVTLTPSFESARFPLRAVLQWGEYRESMLVAEEGRARFPDIPLVKIFDPSLETLQAGLSLTLETTL
jgi:hypothetical protein